MTVSEACQTFVSAPCKQFIVARDPAHGVPREIILHAAGQSSHLFGLRAPILRVIQHIHRKTLAPMRARSAQQPPVQMLNSGDGEENAK